MRGVTADEGIGCARGDIADAMQFIHARCIDLARGMSGQRKERSPITSWVRSCGRRWIVPRWPSKRCPATKTDLGHGEHSSGPGAAISSTWVPRPASVQRLKARLSRSRPAGVTRAPCVEVSRQCLE